MSLKTTDMGPQIDVGDVFEGTLSLEDGANGLVFWRVGEIRFLAQGRHGVVANYFGTSLGDAVIFVASHRNRRGYVEFTQVA